MPTFVLDASSAIHAWDTYPNENFPLFWDWFAEIIHKGEIVLPQDARDEINRILSPCGKWLAERNLEVIRLSDAIVHEAMRIKGILCISNDGYHPKGVDENDIDIIATAKILGCTLVSNEAKQPSLPDRMPKYKIPSVCALPEVNVQCINLINLISRSGRVLG